MIYGVIVIETIFPPQRPKDVIVSFYISQNRFQAINITVKNRMYIGGQGNKILSFTILMQFNVLKI